MTRRRSLRPARALRSALAALLIGLAACDVSDAAPTRVGMEHDPPAHDAMAHPAGDAAGPAQPADFSVYHVESTWTDQTGADRQLASLAGRVQLVAMLYTSCAHACPRTMLDLKRIEGELGPELSDDVGFVVVSIDPARDTPEKLAEFAAGSRLDPDRWTLLTADEGDVLELAAVLGVQYRQTAPGEWVHSNLISVLDPEGEVVHRQVGLGTDPGETLEAIRSVAR